LEEGTAATRVEEGTDPNEVEGKVAAKETKEARTLGRSVGTIA